MLRETPLHAGHIQSKLQAKNNRAIIMPPVPAWYTRPRPLDDIANHSVGRVLDLFDIETDLVGRWAGLGKSGWKRRPLAPCSTSTTRWTRRSRPPWQPQTPARPRPDMPKPSCPCAEAFRPAPPETR